MSKGDRAPLVGFFVVASVRIVDKYEIKKKSDDRAIFNL